MEVNTIRILIFGVRSQLTLFTMLKKYEKLLTVDTETVIVTFCYEGPTNKIHTDFNPRNSVSVRMRQHWSP